VCLRAPRGLEHVRPHAAQKCNSETSANRVASYLPRCEKLRNDSTTTDTQRRQSPKWAPRNVTLARGALTTEIVEEGGSIDALLNK
jgi:hypothetical protein